MIMMMMMMMMVKSDGDDPLECSPRCDVVGHCFDRDSMLRLPQSRRCHQSISICSSVVEPGQHMEATWNVNVAVLLP